MMRSRPGKPGRAWRAALHAAFACLASGAVADDAVVGRAKAQVCAVCHGPLGVAVAPDAPSLAGQPALYLVSQLRAFRGGERKHEVMSLMAKSLSDADIGALAAWYASIRIEAQAPP